MTNKIFVSLLIRCYVIGEKNKCVETYTMPTPQPTGIFKVWGSVRVEDSKKAIKDAKYICFLTQFILLWRNITGLWGRKPDHTCLTWLCVENGDSFTENLTELRISSWKMDKMIFVPQS